MVENVIEFGNETPEVLFDVLLTDQPGTNQSAVRLTIEGYAKDLLT